MHVRLLIYNSIRNKSDQNCRCRQKMAEVRSLYSCPWSTGVPDTGEAAAGSVLFAPFPPPAQGVFPAPQAHSALGSAPFPKAPAQLQLEGSRDTLRVPAPCPNTFLHLPQH